MSDKHLSKRPSTTQPGCLPPLDTSNQHHRPRTSHGQSSAVELPRLRGLKKGTRQRRGSLFDGLPSLEQKRKTPMAIKSTSPASKRAKKGKSGQDKGENMEDMLTQMYGYKNYDNELDGIPSAYGDTALNRCQPWSTTTEAYNRVPTIFNNKCGNVKTLNAHVRVASKSELFCPRCNIFFRSREQYYQHLVYVEMKIKIQSQINALVARVPGVGEMYNLPMPKQSNMVDVHARTSKIATQYFDRQGAKSILRRPDRVNSRLERITPKPMSNGGGGGGGDNSPILFNTDKKHRTYYSEEAAIKQVLHLRHKLTFISNQNQATDKNEHSFLELNKDSWDALRSSIFDQARHIEHKLHEIENELAIAMINDPHNESVGVTQRKYIIQRQNLNALRGEVRQNANDIKNELMSTIKRKSQFKHKGYLFLNNQTNTLLENTTDD